MATTKAGYPAAEGCSSKDGELNRIGVCIKDGFMFFLKQYNCRLFLEVYLLFTLQSWLHHSAPSATLNWVIFHFFAFPHLQTGVDEKSEPAKLEIAQLVHPVQGWWNGKEGIELSYPSGSKCNEKLLWNYQLRHLQQSFWFASLAMEVAILSKE